MYPLIAHTAMPFTQLFDSVPSPLMVAEHRHRYPPTAAEMGRCRSTRSDTRLYQTIAPRMGLRSSLAAYGRGRHCREYEITFRVKLAIAPRLGPFNLDTGGGSQSIGDAPLELTCDLEASSFDTDYFDVVRYRLGQTELEPVRVYVGPHERFGSTRRSAISAPSTCSRFALAGAADPAGLSQTSPTEEPANLSRHLQGHATHESFVSSRSGSSPSALTH